MNNFGTQLPTLLSTDRQLNLIKYSNACAGIAGYISEWGVYKGGSLELLAKHNPESNIIAVDSFEGVAAASKEDYHQEGDFGGVDSRAIIGYFSMLYGNTVRIVKGFIPKVFEYFDEHTRFSFSHVDLDMHDAVKHACDFIYPRTTSGGMILFDDYKVRSTPGATKAIDDFFADKDCAFKGELFFYPGGPSHKQYLVVVK